MKKSEIFKEIFSVVCDCAEVNENDVLDTSNRTEEISYARSAIVGLCKEYGLKVVQIQRYMNARNHGTICYHSSQFVMLSKNDRPFRYLLSCVRHELDKTLMDVRS